MNNEKQTKQGEQPQDWLLPDDVKITETSDPKEMLGKYLAEGVTRTWTETFKDEDTGETVEIERNEPICARGIKCTQDVIQNIMFHIQAGEIKSVKVEDKPRLERTLPLSMRYIVSVSSHAMTTEYIYVPYVYTPEEAADIVTDYLSLYPTENVMGNFTIQECTTTPILFLYDTLAKEKHDIQKPATHLLEHVGDFTPKPHITINPRYWNISLTQWTFDCIQGWQPYRQTVCTDAFDLQQAIRIAHSWALGGMEYRNDESWMVDETKVGKSKITAVIPLEYVKLWRKSHPREEGGEA